MHLLRCFTLGATRFDGILVQVVSQPAEAAIANERVPCQMSGWMIKNLFSALIRALCGVEQDFCWEITSPVTLPFGVHRGVVKECQ